MAAIDDIAALLKSAGLDPRQSNGVLEAFRVALTASGSLAVKEGGTTVSSSITTLDFGTGFDVTESPSGEANVALDMSEAAYNNATSGLAATDVQAAIDELAASGGGSGNSVLATVDFGASFTHYASASVAATWVTAGSEIVVTPLAASGQEVETALLSFNPVVSDLTAGVGFTLHVYTPIEAKGTYQFSCVGV